MDWDSGFNKKEKVSGVMSYIDQTLTKIYTFPTFSYF